MLSLDCMHTLDVTAITFIGKRTARALKLLNSDKGV